MVEHTRPNLPILRSCSAKSPKWSNVFDQICRFYDHSQQNRRNGRAFSTKFSVLMGKRSRRLDQICRFRDHAQQNRRNGRESSTKFADFAIMLSKIAKMVESTRPNLPISRSCSAKLPKWSSVLDQFTAYSPIGKNIHICIQCGADRYPICFVMALRESPLSGVCIKSYSQLVLEAIAGKKISNMLASWMAVLIARQI